MEIIKIQNDWYSMTNEERYFVSEINRGKLVKNEEADQSALSSGFIELGSDGNLVVTEKFNALYDLESAPQ